MTTGSALDLTDLLRRHHLLEPGQMEQVPSLGAGSLEPRALAGELIRRGWLTPYQINQLFRGRGAELLLGSYVLLEKLGEGGMGQVFKAKNWKMGRIVAVKVIRKDKLVNTDAVRRFQREIRAAAQLEHPNIVRALDADEVAGTHLLVMEYVEGTDLARLVKEKGPLPVDQAVNCVVQAAQGLASAHASGIIHRDIKPANLLLGAQGTVKILDLGLARLNSAENALGDATFPEGLTQSGNIMGTCDYMAPEQAINSKRADHRSDIYSLGCTLWFLLAGRRLYDGSSPMEKLLAHREEPIPSLRSLRPDVPQGLESSFHRMVAKKPEHRYKTMSEVIAALEGRVTEESFYHLAYITEEFRRSLSQKTAAEDTHDEVPPSGVTAGPNRPRRRLLLAVAAGLVCVLLVLGVCFTGRLSPRPDPDISTPVGSQLTPAAPSTSQPGILRTRAIGTILGTPFEVVKAPGTFLIGFAASSATIANTRTVVGSIQPIFQSRGDSAIRSFMFGPRQGTATLLLARDGYAVGGLAVSSGTRVDGFKVLFMRIKGDVLDPTDSYESPWFGAVATSSISIGGDGNPVVGVYGHEGDSLCQLGLVQANYQTLGDGKAWKAIRQVETLSDQLRECNPDFDGKLYARIEGDVITGLTLRTSTVSNLTPLKTLHELRTLTANSLVIGKGLLAELGPLHGLLLTELDISHNQVRGLEPLRRMALQSLTAGELLATDLKPLRGMPLKTLNLIGWKGSDLEPLRNLPLQSLSLGSNKKLTNLEPLRGMTLDYLMISNTGVTDLTPLKDMKVRSLECDSTCLSVQNGTVLQAVKPLESLICPITTNVQAAAVRHLKQLQKLNGQPAELFRRGLEAGPITHWRVVGPFARGAAQPFTLLPGGAVPDAESEARYPGKGGLQVGWKALEADSLGRVTLAKEGDKLVEVSSFAYATVQAEAATDADIWVGSDDWHIFWLNGVKVHQHQNQVPRALLLPGARVRVRLRAGTNHFLIRCDNYTGPWEFSVRVSSD